MSLTDPWVLQTTPTDVGTAFTSVCWSPELGLFCAVAWNGTTKVATSPDGINWTTRTIPGSSANWESICWSPGLHLFVAVANSAAAPDDLALVMTSPDGINWTRRTPSNTALPWYDVCWSAELGIFVAVCSSIYTTTSVMTSPDGINWTLRTTPVANYWMSICWAASIGLFCAVAYNGNFVNTDKIMTSPDGINWTIRTSATKNELTAVCWSPELNLFVIIDDYSELGIPNHVQTSPDGINWTARTSAGDQYDNGTWFEWWNICWSKEQGVFVAVASYGPGANDAVMTSPDGINWTIRTANSNKGWADVVWSPQLGKFVAVGSSRDGTLNHNVMTWDFPITIPVTPIMGEIKSTSMVMATMSRGADKQISIDNRYFIIKRPPIQFLIRG